MIGNDLSKTEFLELSDFNGLDHDRLINLSVKRIKSSFSDY